MFRSTYLVNFLVLSGILTSSINSYHKSLASENIDASQDSKKIHSVYTDIKPDTCHPIEKNEEGGSVTSRCRGYNNIPVYVKITQHKDFLNIGHQGDPWESPPSDSNFNSLGKKVEWRLQEDKPFAAIYRHIINHSLPPEMLTGVPSSYLAVIKIATEKEKSCITAFVSGSIPNANEIARNYADENTASFKCGEEKAKTIIE